MAKPTSAQDSNSKEKTYKPNWNPFYQRRSDWLSLLTKLVSVRLDSILFHLLTHQQKLRYWFLTRAILAHNEKSFKISSPSSTSLVTAWARNSEITNNKYAKTLSYQIYRCHKLAAIWKKWVSAVRKVYHISITYLNEHQGFTKIGNSREKLGLKMVLKTSGLIPELRIAQTLVAFKTRIQYLRLKCYKQIASALAPTCDFISFTTFETYQIVVKTSYNLRSKTARAMMNWDSDPRSVQTLQNLCYLDGSKLVGNQEKSTSKTLWSWENLY
ncbi:hypothetical protein QUB60_12770 [Microcoleus sp. A2-C5]|uniref:hypothetical protein n=1 Tax=unclassified Microcoleus TaxID=2642155 RepID=UPI002FD40CF4